MASKLLLLLIAVLKIVFLEGNDQIVIHGHIKFDKTPNSLPKGSCLILKLEDTRRSDAAAITIEKRIFKGSDLKITPHGTPYNLTSSKAKRDIDYTISAVLNVGWCANGGDHWIHQGDYLTATSFTVQFSANKNSYEEDIELEHYGHAAEKDHVQKKEQEKTHPQKKKLQNLHLHKKEADPCIDAPCMNSICRSFANGTYICIKVAGMPCAMPSCSEVYDPICASNGKTYDNECIMESDSCPDGVKISLVKIHDGECYSKHPMLGGVLFLTCIVLLTVLGFFSIFWIWKRNRRTKLNEKFESGSASMLPLGI